MYKRQVLPDWILAQLDALAVPAWVQLMADSFWPLLHAGLVFTVPLTLMSFALGLALAFVAVSYTHLDVYKRQVQVCPGYTATSAQGVAPQMHAVYASRSLPARARAMLAAIRQCVDTRAA